MSKAGRNIWSESEGDNWFKRNKEKLGKSSDMVMLLTSLYKIRPKKVIEIGCSNGYRLSLFHKKYRCKVIGIEPSQQAIAYGIKKWPFIKFTRGLCESFKLNDKADLVIVNFVLHWVFRDNLIKCVEQINAVLEPGGFLVIGDFGTLNFIKRKYHHLPQQNLFTYKQRYQNIFMETGLYREIARLTYNHNTSEMTTDTDYTNVGTVSLLKKSEVYIEDK